jgi:predicted DCC family thiol-disulfide oxidoreductase YuxK
MAEAPLFVFDGDCVLCSRTVRFVLRTEAAAVVRFCAVQSATGQRLVTSLGLSAMPETFLFVENGHAYGRSEAAFRLATYLRAPWQWLRLLRVLPRGLTDWAYDRVARNRYQWFGQQDTCLMPVPEQRERFILD